MTMKDNNACLNICFPPFPGLIIKAKNKKIVAIRWCKTTHKKPVQHLNGTANEVCLLKTLARDLKAYFSGEKVALDWPLDWNQGTAFEQEVWHVLQKIPYGETRSYKWVANSINRPAASRAIGNANAKNPFPIVVPCHRIIKNNGNIGGYSGGISIKHRMLTLEKNNAYNF